VLGGTYQGNDVAGEHGPTEREQDPDDQVVTEQEAFAEHGPSVPGSAAPRHPTKRETLAMGFHHVALATRDTAATHRFYTDVMGFELVKVVASPTPGEHGGWSKHFFYDTSGSGVASGDGGMIAFWEIHDTAIGDSYPVDINASAGLPWWVNHVAFEAPTRDDLDRHRDRWRSHGHTVLEIDHDFCTSIYIRDPSNNMVEFCHTNRSFTAEERARAVAVLTDDEPVFDRHDPQVIMHQPLRAATPA
jgi:catechol 2,3-dioxygenase-like lactoylglutathione lyase family enzyme